jgi:hypothetical protein
MRAARARSAAVTATTAAPPARFVVGGGALVAVCGLAEDIVGDEDDGAAGLAE